MRGYVIMDADVEKGDRLIDKKLPLGKNGYVLTLFALLTLF